MRVIRFRQGDWRTKCLVCGGGLRPDHKGFESLCKKCERAFDAPRQPRDADALPDVVVVYVSKGRYQFIFRVDLCSETVWIKRYPGDDFPHDNQDEVRSCFAERPRDFIVLHVDEFGRLPAHLEGRVL